MAKHLCCLQLDCTEVRDFSKQDSIPGNPKQDLLDLGSSVLSIKPAQRELGRKIRKNLLDVCYLLLKHSSQSWRGKAHQLAACQFIYFNAEISHAES